MNQAYYKFSLLLILLTYSIDLNTSNDRYNHHLYEKIKNLKKKPSLLTSSFNFFKKYSHELSVGVLTACLISTMNNKNSNISGSYFSLCLVLSLNQISDSFSMQKKNKLFLYKQKIQKQLKSLIFCLEKIESDWYCAMHDVENLIAFSYNEKEEFLPCMCSTEKEREEIFKIICMHKNLYPQASQFYSIKTYIKSSSKLPPEKINLPSLKEKCVIMSHKKNILIQELEESLKLTNQTLDELLELNI